MDAVCEVLEQPLIIFARSEAPYNNTAELLAYVKNNPDVKIPFGLPGVGSSGQTGAEIFLTESGLRDHMLLVFYGAFTVQALIACGIAFFFQINF